MNEKFVTISDEELELVTGGVFLMMDGGGGGYGPGGGIYIEKPVYW